MSNKQRSIRRNPLPTPDIMWVCVPGIKYKRFKHSSQQWGQSRSFPLYFWAHFFFPSHFVWLFPIPRNDFSPVNISTPSPRVARNEKIPRNFPLVTCSLPCSRDTPCSPRIYTFSLGFLVMLLCNSVEKLRRYDSAKIRDHIHDKLCCSSVRDDEGTKRDRVTWKKRREWRETSFSSGIREERREKKDRRYSEIHVWKRERESWFSLFF